MMHNILVKLVLYDGVKVVRSRAAYFWPSHTSQQYACTLCLRMLSGFITRYNKNHFKTNNPMYVIVMDYELFQRNNKQANIIIIF